MKPRIPLSDFVPELFQGPQTKVRLGRPLSLGDGTLQIRRDRLVGIFEAYWGEIGWKIRKCRKPDDLVSIFSALPGAMMQDVLAVFCIPSTLPASNAALRKARHEERALIGPHRNAYELSRQADERLQNARKALPQAKKKHDRKLVRKELVRRKNEAQKTSDGSRQIAEEESRLATQIRLLEASVARQELLRFLKSRRYELNPFNLANAAAGLPFMGWRQSMRRCLKDRKKSFDSLHYQVFKVIRYLISTARKKTKEGLLQHFREQIPLLRQRYKLSQAELAEKWFYLERALRETCRAKVHPKSLEFEITKRYFKQMQVQSPTNILLAERNKLSLSGKRDERLSQKGS